MSEASPIFLLAVVVLVLGTMGIVTWIVEPGMISHGTEEPAGQGESEPDHPMLTMDEEDRLQSPIADSTNDAVGSEANEAGADEVADDDRETPPAAGVGAEESLDGEGNESTDESGGRGRPDDAGPPDDVGPPSGPPGLSDRDA